MSRRLAIPILCSLLLLVLNVLIIRKLFRVEYSAYLASNEGQFVEIAKQVAAHPGDLLWWPEWDCGLPFVNTYLPLLPFLAGLWSRISAQSAGLALHQVAAAAFCLSPVALFWLALIMSRGCGLAFFAALLYSVFSPSTLLVRTDCGGLGSLCRLQVVTYFAESPYTLSIALVPLAILFLYLAVVRGKFWQGLVAGVVAAAAFLANAFGGVILALAGFSTLAAGGSGRPLKDLRLLLAIGALTYLWISPLAPPSVLAAIRMNAPSVNGDYRFTLRSLGGVCILGAGFALIALAARKAKWPAHLRFSLLFAWLTTGIVVLGTAAKIYVVPQPERYRVAMDMGLCLVAAFGIGEWLRRLPGKAAIAVALVSLVPLSFLARHDMRAGRRSVQSVDLRKTAVARITRWIDTHMPGTRVMLPGTYSFDFNNLSATPQLQGGQEPMLPNFVMRIAGYAILTGVKGDPRDGPVGVLWLKALGAHAIVVPGPQSEEAYKPFANPRKFEGILPVLWREGDDTIYAVPARSTSLAHVIDAAAVIRRRPATGFDMTEIEPYVKALDSPESPEATWHWTNRHSASVHAMVRPGQVISVQVTYHPGWHATWNGIAQPTYPDGLGLLVVKPACQGSCDLALWFDGGLERQAALWVSAAVVVAVVLMGWWWGRSPACPPAKSTF